ncbi:MAG: hypothetical protein OJJ21_22300 [Ferrovibrio sp.]|uniref:hypothetical protein n=1 Tax=Ferrovibrio sp. TaxID=1917215 RepID=UPI002605AC5B|nr:hypothetical protein [Ferrovibrio sp.]MCW0236346.1 hypothetical protein [Ferrovibrio sp.]
MADGGGFQEDGQFTRISVSMPKLVRRLAKFNLVATAAMVAGLMTRQENHPAWPRLEAMQHLVIAHCRGHEIPTTAQLREFINGFISHAGVTMSEDPASDVFVTNVGYFDGNARLIGGDNADNDYSLECCLYALNALPDGDWKAQVLRSVSALLRCADAVAELSGLKRNAWKEVLPDKPLQITTKLMDELKWHVMVPRGVLSEHAINNDLAPFILVQEDNDLVLGGSLEASILDRKPVLLTDGFICFAMPNATSAAARQFILHSVQAAGHLAQFADAIAQVQSLQMRFHAKDGWRIKPMSAAELGFEPGPKELIGRFDDGGYVHVIYSPGDLNAVIQDGLVNARNGTADAEALSVQRAAQLSARPDFRRGLVIVGFGGIGGGHIFNPQGLHADWSVIGISPGDFIRLASDHDTSAARAWKLLEQERLLRERGYTIVNVGGFLPLYSYALKRGFSLLPSNMAEGFLALDASFEAPLRHRLRLKMDAHVMPLPRERAYINIHRFEPSGYMSSVEPLPMYYSPSLRGRGIYAGCRVMDKRCWWVELQPAADGTYTYFGFSVWDMALCWMTRVAAEVEAALPDLQRGALAIVIAMPPMTDAELGAHPIADPMVPPTISLDRNIVTVTCSPDYFTSFQSPVNHGDRMMVDTLVRAAYALANTPPDEAQIAAIVTRVIPDDKARFIHTRPTNAVRDHIFREFKMPPVRFIPPEDIAWAHSGLTVAAGWANGPGQVPADQTPALLNQAVDALWERIKGRLATFNRANVIATALANFEAIEHDRANWKLLAAATLSLYGDSPEVFAEGNEREGRRSAAGLASRVLAEMAVCECPAGGGLQMTGIDMDSLLADIIVLVECAGYSDNIKYKLSSQPLVVHPNQTFGFDTTVMQKLMRPYMEVHGTRTFLSAAAAYAKAYEVRDAEPGGDGPLDELEAVFVAEFGIGLAGLGPFAGEILNRARETGSSQVSLPRSVIVQMLRDAGAADAEKALKALTLLPRLQWYEENPENAAPRDWYPWRYNRRLSVIRRPMVQVDATEDPTILVMPTLLEITVRFLMDVASGGIPHTLFDSEPMTKYIGAAADRAGREFSELTAAKMAEFGYQTRTEVKMTELGGTQPMGDVDVLAWRAGSNEVLIKECKRLAFARTPGEIGERLQEYSTIAPAGQRRTPIQKHIDRMAFLNANRAELARITGIPADQMVLKSILVTDILVPMQFSQEALGMVGVVVDFSQLEEKFGG